MLARLLPVRPGAGLVVAATLATVMVLVSGAPSAHAVNLTLQLDPGPGADFARRAGLDLQRLEDLLEEQINKQFQLHRIDDYLDEIGHGQSFSNRGLGVDYAPDFKVVQLGVTGNVVFNRDSAHQGTGDPVFDFGRGANLSIMAGLNLDYFGLGPFNIYTNYFFGQRNHFNVFNMKTVNFGLHLQAHLFRPKGTGIIGQLFRWGGIDITTGVEQEKGIIWQDGIYRTDIDLGQLDPQARGFLVGLNAAGAISFYTRAVTIPVEVTTSLRLFHLVSLFGGVGYDIKVASAIDAYMATVATLTPKQRIGGSVQSGPDIGTARIQVNELRRLSAGWPRVMGGVQANLFLLKIFVQGSLLLHDPILTSIAGGIRLAY